MAPTRGTAEISMDAVTPTSSRRRRTDPMEILAEASEIVSGYTLDLDELLRQLAALVLKVVQYQVIAVFLKSGKDSLRIRFAIGYREEIVRNLRLKIGEGIVGAAAATLQTVAVNDVTRDPRYLMAVDAARSEVAVPLVARGKLVGVIDLQSPALDAFGEYECKLLELIGSRFSLAIDGARAHRATMQRNRTLQTLSDIAQEFSHILHLEELLKKISSLVRELIPYDAFSIFLLDEKSRAARALFRRTLRRAHAVAQPAGRQGNRRHGGPSAEPVLVRDTTLDKRYVAAVEGIRSEVAVPLMLQRQGDRRPRPRKRKDRRLHAASICARFRCWRRRWPRRSKMRASTSRSPPMRPAWSVTCARRASCRSRCCRTVARRLRELRSPRATIRPWRCRATSTIFSRFRPSTSAI